MFKLIKKIRIQSEIIQKQDELISKQKDTIDMLFREISRRDQKIIEQQKRLRFFGIEIGNEEYEAEKLDFPSTPEIEKRIEAKNKELRSTAHFVELENGKKEYYNEFTEEPECLAFKGLHSKCYGVVTSKGLEITIAGVPARTIIGMDGDKPIYYTREQELAGSEKDPVKALDHLSDRFTFKVNTGICALYVGATGYQTDRKPQILNIDGHEIHTAGGCVLKKLESKTVKMDPNNDNKENYDPNYNPASI